MADPRQVTPQWSNLSRFASVCNKHYKDCINWLQTGVPPDFSTVQIVFNIPIPPLNNNIYGIQTYISTFHQAVKTLYANAGILASNTVGDVNYNAALLAITQQFASYPISPSSRIPVRFIKKVKTVILGRGAIAYTDLPQLVKDRTDCDMGSLTNNGTTTVYRYNRTNGVTETLQGAANYTTSNDFNLVGASGQTDGVVIGQSIWSVGCIFDFWMPNWVLNRTTGLEIVMWITGTQHNLSLYIWQTADGNASALANRAAYALYNDIYARLVDGIEEILGRIDSAQFGF